MSSSNDKDRMGGRKKGTKMAGTREQQQVYQARPCTHSRYKVSPFMIFFAKNDPFFSLGFFAYFLLILPMFSLKVKAKRL